MSKTRIIDTNFYQDTYVGGLKPEYKFLFLYFLTNSRTNLCGIYEISLPLINIETGLDIKEINKMIERFAKDDKMYYFNGWIVIKNYTKYQFYNPNMKLGVEKEFNKIPNYIWQSIKNLNTLWNDLQVLWISKNIHAPQYVSQIEVGEVSEVVENKPMEELVNEIVLSKNIESSDIEAANYLWSCIKERLPNHKEPNLDDWTMEISKMRRIDKREPEMIMDAIKWATQDSFWQANIMSPAKLRKHFDMMQSQAISKKDGAKISPETLRKILES